VCVSYEVARNSTMSLSTPQTVLYCNMLPVLTNRDFLSRKTTWPKFREGLCTTEVGSNLGGQPGGRKEGSE